MIDLDIKKMALAASVVFALSACQQESTAGNDEKGATEKVATSTDQKSSVKGDVKDEDKLGYALGAKMANFILTDTGKHEIKNFNKESVAKGFNDAINGTGKLSEQEIATQFAIFQQQMQAAQQQAAVIAQKEQADSAENAKAEGIVFLAENGKKEGVTTTESGLQYSVIKEGKEGAAKPKATDTITIHYHGTFINGDVFDSSVDKGKPITYPLNGFIKGWIEGLQLMSVGSKYHLFVPGDLAYGANGRPGIPGNSVLEFDVELISIEPTEEKKDEK